MQNFENWSAALTHLLTMVTTKRPNEAAEMAMILLP